MQCFGSSLSGLPFALPGSTREGNTMKITFSMALFWISMAFSPLGAAISALSVIPTEITLLRTWELSGLMLPGAPSEIMFTGIMLAAGNVMLGLIYVYHNEINLPGAIQGTNRKDVRITCVSFAIATTSFAIILSSMWVHSILSLLY